MYCNTISVFVIDTALASDNSSPFREILSERILEMKKNSRILTEK